MAVKLTATRKDGKKEFGGLTIMLDFSEFLDHVIREKVFRRYGEEAMACFHGTCGC